MLLRRRCHRTPTHVPQGDATVTMRSLHLPAAGEATIPTDLNGTGEGVLWHHSQHPAGTWGCDACQCDTVLTA